MNLKDAGDWWTLCTLIVLLGCRHGVDADHLVAVDGWTRYHRCTRPLLSRYCGVLFSLGHGAVVLAIALVVGNAAGGGWPGWVNGLGALISATSLSWLGWVNLRTVWVAPAGYPVQLQGVKGRLQFPLAVLPGAWAVACTGALFALSFDTLSQAAMFALLAARFGGWEHALVLGLLFTGGMVLVDGVNGWWVFRLLRRTDRWGIRASHCMGWLVSFASFGVAALSLARWVVA